MSDILLIAILVMLVLNGGWPGKIHNYVTRTHRRLAHDVRRRIKNARANRRKRRREIHG